MHVQMKIMIARAPMAGRLAVAPPTESHKPQRYQLSHDSLDCRQLTDARSELIPALAECQMAAAKEAGRPPSTTTVWPLMWPAAGEARNAMAAATSAGAPW
jgi:hypothetical protein